MRLGCGKEKGIYFILKFYSARQRIGLYLRGGTFVNGSITHGVERRSVLFWVVYTYCVYNTLYMNNCRITIYDFNERSN